MKAFGNGRSWILLAALVAALTWAGCKQHKDDDKAAAPQPAVVVPDTGAANFKVDHPEQFALVAAESYAASPELNVTGVVQPDIARAVPVVSLASGRVVEVHARLGDEVKKGQLLLKVRSNDVSGAFQNYQKAQNDERLARTQYERTKLLYEHGASSKSALEQAEAAANDARVDLNTATEQLHLLGVDKDHPSGVVNVLAPISGVITDQQVVNAGGVQGLSGPNPFTIADLSSVWIVCDVYENDLDAVRVGERADIHLAAYPGRVLHGKVDNILPTLDPALHTAKVRIEVANPGLLRIGMFVTATFYGKQPVTHAAIPATAILHLHDRMWVFVPVDKDRFKRQEVAGGAMLPNGLQEIARGLDAGTKVVQNALVMQNTVEQ
ncbi:MAG: efflux RND transporter periplasmic adaptor subunit [Acidobacteriota bacterium]|nr:efflux RND transporter periplasmic adaptor subunit [Acidobacteriota bacterium]